VKKSVILIVLAVCLLESSIYACTGFCVSKGDLVLVGNNEDWKNPFTKVWYVPAENGTYGRVSFGFDNFYPQGGMNEKGLVFDGFATAPHKVKNSLNKPTYGGNLMDKVMSECATVDEALQIFDKYNLEFMERAMFFIADENGESAIIEGDKIIRKDGKYQIITNFYQSEVKDGKIPCDRYKIADAMLKDVDEISVDLCKRILAATHNEGQFPTVYSNVYDLKKRIVYLYHFHNFQNVVKIDLTEELKKGARRMDLTALFPRMFIAEVFKNKMVNELEAQKAKYTHKVKRKILESYVGRYQVPADEGEPTVVIITREGDKIFAGTKYQEKQELYPVSDTEFVYVTSDVGVKMMFVIDSNGKATKLKAEAEGKTYTAERIE
jgi:penicillin V acylase-like amidase (Ntn superfamily)